MRLTILLLLPVLAWGQASPSQPNAEPKQQATPKKEEAATDHKVADKPAADVRVANAPTKQPEAQNDGEDGQLWRELTSTVDGATFWVLAIQSVFLVLTIREMTKSDERQLRPYVSINLTNPPWPTPSGIISFNFKCLNHGQSPAKNVAFRADAWCMDVPIPAGHPAPPLVGPWNEGRMNIFPNEGPERAENWNIPCTLGKPMTAQKVQAIMTRTRTLVLAVEVRYMDMFKKTHVTREYYAVPGGGGFNLLPNTSFLT